MCGVVYFLMSSRSIQNAKVQRTCGNCVFRYGLRLSSFAEGIEDVIFFSSDSETLECTPSSSFFFFYYFSMLHILTKKKYGTLLSGRNNKYISSL
jgi:hypothetical protein